MICFSDLWRCIERGAFTDLKCKTGLCDKNRRGLCAIPPRRKERLSPDCEATVDHTWGLSWPSQPQNTVHSQACPLGQKGVVEWACGDWGMRESPEPDYSNCTCTEISGHLISLPGSNPTNVLNTVNSDISSQNGSLATGDIGTIIELLDAAANVQDYHVSQSPEGTRKNLSEQFLLSSLATVDALVSNTKVWLGLESEETVSEINSIQSIVDTASKQLIENIDSEI